MIRCVVESVRVHELIEQHVVNLRDDSGAMLPIWIAADTATAIENALAVRTGAPIDVDEAIFAKSAVKPAR